jgi:hypothetical protein
MLNDDRCTCFRAERIAGVRLVKDVSQQGLLQFPVGVNHGSNHSISVAFNEVERVLSLLKGKVMGRQRFEIQAARTDQIEAAIGFSI